MGSFHTVTNSADQKDQQNYLGAVPKLESPDFVGCHSAETPTTMISNKGFQELLSKNICRLTWESLFYTILAATNILPFLL